MRAPPFVCLRVVFGWRGRVLKAFLVLVGDFIAGVLGGDSTCWLRRGLAASLSFFAEEALADALGRPKVFGLVGVRET